VNSLILSAVALVFAPDAMIGGQLIATTRGPSPVSGLLSQPAGEPSAAVGRVKRALREGKYPWYDSEADELRPDWPTKIGWLDWVTKRIDALIEAIGKFLGRLNFGRARSFSLPGDQIGSVILLTALGVFLASIIWLWRRRMSGTADGESVRTTLGTSARLTDLPEGVGLEDRDPWAEAERRRAAGDLAGAVVCVFAHQLLSLDHLGLVRLIPGRTGRQYVQVVRDQVLADSLRATLRLFEDVYYGRQQPTNEAFESVWHRALLFRERGRLLGAGASR
jgi:hypothetical protein